MDFSLNSRKRTLVSNTKRIHFNLKACTYKEMIMATKAKKTASKTSAKKKIGKKKTAAKKTAKKTDTKKKTATKKTSSKKTPKKTSSHTSRIHHASSTQLNISAEERWRMVAITAYHKAEARGFAPGNEAKDWFEAENEVDTLLKSKNKQ